MEKTQELALVSVGDYVRELDNVVVFRLLQGEKQVGVPVRIVTPMAKDDHIVLEMVTDEFSDDLAALSKYEDDDPASVAPEDRKKMLRFSLLQTSCLISSACYKPTLTFDAASGVTSITDPQPLSPEKMWADGPTVLEECPKPLFGALKKHLEGEDVGATVTEIETQK